MKNNDMMEDAAARAGDSPWDVIAALRGALKSTGPSVLVVMHCGMTAEVNWAELEQVPGRPDKWRLVGSYGGSPINESWGVPACFAMDGKGKLRALIFWGGRWVGVYHRTLQHCREWEFWPIDPA